MQREKEATDIELQGAKIVQKMTREVEVEEEILVYLVPGRG